MFNMITRVKGLFQKDEELTLEQWREKSYLFVLMSIALFALPALVLSSLRAIEDGLLLNCIAYLAAYSGCLFLIFARSINFSLRAWLSILMLTVPGVLAVFNIGPIGSGRIWFFTTSTFATLILGGRAGLVLVFFQIMILFLYGYLVDQGMYSLKIPQEFSYDIWNITTITFSFLSIVTVIAMGSLIRGLVMALTKSRENSDQLRESGRQLRERIAAHNESLESLKESEERWRFALESSEDGLWDWNAAEDVIHFSPGYSLKDDYNHRTTDGTLDERMELLHPDDRDRIYQAVRDLQSGKRTSYKERYRVKRRNGSYKWVFDRSKVISYDESGAPMRIIGLYTDITRLKQMEQENLELHSRLSQTQKMESLGTMAGGIAHDFNNILSAIMGYGELAAEQIERNSRARKDLDEVLKASRRATKLVQQILMFSRKGSLEKKPLHLQVMIKEGVKMMRASLPSTVEIVEQYPEQRMLVLADPTNIHQVVINLLTNAYQAMKDQKGVVKIELRSVEIDETRVAGEWDVRRGLYTVLSVEDNGPGMDEETRKQIFDPYFTTKSQGEGTGLGLATVHGIVNDCNGFITVDTQLGTGTVFNVHFPVLQSKPEQADLAFLTDREQLLNAARGNERILLVDDEQGLCEVGKAQLTKLGYEVTTMTGSMEALEYFVNDPQQFDLIISDQTMPNLTGVELAQKVFAIRPDIPFILYTGFTSVVNKEDALATGISAFLKKPLTAVQLSEQVRLVLDAQ